MDDTYTDRRPHQNISPKQAYDARARAWAFVFQCWHQKQMITRFAPESDSCDDYEKPANEERSQSDVNENAIVVAEGDRTEGTVGGAALLAAPPLTEGVVALYTKERTAPNKRLLSVRVESIPKELRVRPQWVVWKAVGEKPDKVPYSARSERRASSTDLITWSTFEEALDAYENGEYAGLGFVFSSGDPYTGIDLDGCVDEYGHIAPWALEIIQHLNSYTELSVTGTGVHVIVKGDVPNSRNGNVEVYSSKRFFTVTGHVVEVGDD